MSDDELWPMCPEHDESHRSADVNGELTDDLYCGRCDWVYLNALSEAAAQPPAPITAEDVRAAERAWEDLPAWDYSPYYRAGHVDPRAAFVADFLNRRRP